MKATVGMIKLFDNLLKADKKNYAVNTKVFLSLTMEVCSKETSTKHGTAETFRFIGVYYPSKQIYIL